MKKSTRQIAHEIGDVLAAGLHCAELCDLIADGGSAQLREFREASNNYHAASAAFFGLPKSEEENG
jgi:hypothetical protein